MSALVVKREMRGGMFHVKHVVESCFAGATEEQRDFLSWSLESRPHGRPVALTGIFTHGDSNAVKVAPVSRSLEARGGLNVTGGYTSRLRLSADVARAGALHPGIGGQ